MIIRCWDTEISIFVFSAFSTGQSFWKCDRRGSESSNFHLNITDSYYLGSKHSEKYVHSYKHGGCEWRYCLLLLAYAWIACFPGFSRGATFRHIHKFRNSKESECLCLYCHRTQYMYWEAYFIIYLFFFLLLSFLWVLSKMCFPANIRSSIWIFND